MIYSSGQDLRSIKNRAYAKYDTGKAEKIVLALDKCGVPYFARFNNAEISLTYDNDYAITVSEIIAKAMSGDYEEMILEIQSRKNPDGYKVLLSEIAEILNISISFLKSRPDEVQEGICKAYVDLWYCDTDTIKRELSEILKINFSTEHDEEKQRKPVEIVPQNYVQKERSHERERRF
ncbi:MAG: hypothetical protein NC320_13240 [Clostridium sp.]|nr:hypothetical protein [Clostridium sp.]